MQIGAIRYKLVQTYAPSKSINYTLDLGIQKMGKNQVRILEILDTLRVQTLDMLQTIFALKALKRKLFLKSRCLNS